MIKSKISIFFLPFLLLNTSCDDVFEKDIRDEVVNQIFPVEGQVLTTNDIPFQWSDSEEADSFRFQIAQANNLFVTDTLVNAISFVETLELGDYKWRVRAENFAYESKYSNFTSFSVVTPSNLDDVTLMLNSPTDNSFANTKEILFRWDNVENTTNYVFSLIRVLNGVETIAFVKEDLLQPQIQITEAELAEDGVYRWSVKGVNLESETSESFRIINIDTQVPPLPQLLTPVIDQEFPVASEISFSWSFLDTGLLQTNISSTIEISTDADFLNVVQSEVVSDLMFNYTPTDQATYYWRVSGVDEANNRGTINATGRFIVN